MNKEKYKEIVKKNLPKEPRLRNTIMAFIGGGLIGLLGELFVMFLMNYFHTSRVDSYSYLAFALILLATFITAIGLFDKLVSKFKCGLIVPTTGFAHSVQSAVIDYKKDGLINGIGSNAFKLAGSVIYYGIISSFFFILIKVILFD